MRQQAHHQQSNPARTCAHNLPPGAARGIAAPSNLRHPVRLEGVTHVLGTNCNLCVRAGHTARREALTFG